MQALALDAGPASGAGHVAVELAQQNPDSVITCGLRAVSWQRDPRR